MTTYWLIPTPLGDYRVRIARANAPVSQRDADIAQQLWFFADCELEDRVPEAVAAALELYTEFSGIRLSPLAVSDAMVLDELRRTLASATHAGRLTFEPALPPVVRPRQRQVAPLSPQTYSPTEEPAEDDFIEIELVGEDDQPIGKVAYLVKLPDGGERSGKLNSRGFARIERIPSGQCEVTFPELDAEAWCPA